MSRVEDIHTSMWSDPDFEALGRDASLLLIWSWTNTRCGMAGLYKVSKRAMAESKVDAADLDAALAELQEARMVYYEDSVLWVRARVKRLRQKTVQIAKAIKKDVGLIDPDHPLRQAFLFAYADLPWLREQLATLGGPSGDPHGGVTTTDLSQNQGGSPDALPSVKGKGKGTGKGSSLDARERWFAWAERNMPGVHPAFAANAAVMIETLGCEVTPESVAERLRATYPHVLESASADEAAGLTNHNQEAAA